MPVTMTAKDLARWLYSVDEPSHSQMNTVTKMCRTGEIANAHKIGRDWRINCTAEWPDMFPEPAGDPGPDPIEALADLLEAAARLLREMRGDDDGEKESDAA